MQHSPGIDCMEALVLGKIRVPNVVAAPMAGVTDLPFRRMVRCFFSGLCFTEMLSAEASVRGNPQTEKMSCMDQGPTGVQLVGSSPDVMARAALQAQERGAVVVDINAGCPDPHVVKKGGGAAFMKDLDNLQRVIGAVESAVDIPVTVKVRGGWRQPRIKEVAEALENQNIAWVVFHPRTADERYSVAAEHKRTGDMVEFMGDIPVIASGDVLSVESALSIMQSTGCAGVMPARGMRGDPELPARILSGQRGMVTESSSLDVRCQRLMQHASFSVDFFGEELGMKRMRKHAFWYLKGVPKARLPWLEINRMLCLGELEDICKKVLE